MSHFKLTLAGFRNITKEKKFIYEVDIGMKCKGFSSILLHASADNTILGVAQAVLAAHVVLCTILGVCGLKQASEHYLSISFYIISPFPFI